MTNAIEIQGLKKRYPRTETFKDALTFWRRNYIDALRGVDLEIDGVDTFGILGPNGAGKTTLLKILAGLVLPDDGRIIMNGTDVTRKPGEIPGRLMYVFGEERSLNWRLTGWDNLKFYTSLFEVPRKGADARVDEVLEIVGLTDFARERVMKYSTGMRHRLVIARGLLADASILLLDEPTRSLDPSSAKRLWDFIKDILIGQLGRTIVIATHNMEEAAYLCSKVAILNRGVVVASGTVDEIRSMLDGQQHCVIKVGDSPSDGVMAWLGATNWVTDIKIDSPNGSSEYSLHLTMDDPRAHLGSVVRRLVESGNDVTQVISEKQSLTDVIVKLGASGN